MKQITQNQIDAIIQAFYDVNAPIKLYASVKEMLEKLPNIKDKKDEGIDKID